MSDTEEGKLTEDLVRVNDKTQVKNKKLGHRETRQGQNKGPSGQKKLVLAKQMAAAKED